MPSPLSFYPFSRSISVTLRSVSGCGTALRPSGYMTTQYQRSSTACIQQPSSTIRKRRRERGTRSSLYQRAWRKQHRLWNHRRQGVISGGEVPLTLMCLKLMCLYKYQHKHLLPLHAPSLYQIHPILISPMLPTLASQSLSSYPRTRGRSVWAPREGRDQVQGPGFSLPLGNLENLLTVILRRN